MMDLLVLKVSDVSVHASVHLSAEFILKRLYFTVCLYRQTVMIIIHALAHRDIRLSDRSGLTCGFLAPGAATLLKEEKHLKTLKEHQEWGWKTE